MDHETYVGYKWRVSLLQRSSHRTKRACHSGWTQCGPSFWGNKVKTRGELQISFTTSNYNFKCLLSLCCYMYMYIDHFLLMIANFYLLLEYHLHGVHMFQGGSKYFEIFGPGGTKKGGPNLSWHNLGYELEHRFVAEHTNLATTYKVDKLTYNSDNLPAWDSTVLSIFSASNLFPSTSIWLQFYCQCHVGTAPRAMQMLEWGAMQLKYWTVISLNKKQISYGICNVLALGYAKNGGCLSFKVISSNGCLFLAEKNCHLGIKLYC